MQFLTFLLKIVNLKVIFYMIDMNALIIKSLQKKLTNKYRLKNINFSIVENFLFQTFKILSKYLAV